MNEPKPVFQFFEDGDWLRIEAKGRPNRYIHKSLALNLLNQFGIYSVTEKSDIIVRETELVV